MNTSPLDADARARFLILARNVDGDPALRSRTGADKLTQPERLLSASMLLGFFSSPDALSVAPSAISAGPFSADFKHFFDVLFEESRVVPSGAFVGQDSSTLMIVGALVGVVIGGAVGFAFAR